jgi:hypothetical protein
MSENDSRRGTSENGAPECAPPATPPLSEEERRALAALPRELTPPTGLEDRLVAALRREDLLNGRTTARASSPTVLLLAASLLCLILGLAGGWLLRSARGGGELAEPSYLLALYEAPGASTDETEHRRLASEYAAWARERAAAGELLAGEPLAPRGWLLAPGSPSPAPATIPSAAQPELVGYFLIRAAGRERALEIAADCPHLRHGGSVLVRPIRR